MSPTNAANPSYEILVVDDEADVRTALAGILEDDGYTLRKP